MNILQIKPLAKEFGCQIDVAWQGDDYDMKVIVTKGAQTQTIGTLHTVTAMTREELQAIFESVSGTSLRDWWSGSEARR